MKYLGIDYGLNHLGLAVSDGLFIEPYRKLKTQNSRQWRGSPLAAKLKTTSQKLKVIRTITISEEVEEVILGISEGKMAEKTKKFGEELKKITGLPVKYIDETLTSQEAVRKMIESGRGKKFRQKEEHNIAACIILQSYLDSRL